MHYLLRQKPYRVMWGGVYVASEDNITAFSRTEDFLGISTYLDYKNFERDNDDLQSKSYYDTVRFIADNRKQWKRIDVWDEAIEYFNWENTHSVKYSGYLLNHTQKLAVDLANYHKQSKFLNPDGIDMAIDLVPVLTETGGGTQMALFNGVSTDSTEELDMTWCGDLLQLVEDLPEDYILINCCFSEIWNRAKYCHLAFGVNDDGYLLNDSNGKLFEGSALSIRGGRGLLSNLKVEDTEDEIIFRSVDI
jgi:hypothetical protein